VDDCLGFRSCVVCDGGRASSACGLKQNLCVPQGIRSIVPKRALLNVDPPHCVLPAEGRCPQNAAGLGLQEIRAVSMRSEKRKHVSETHVYASRDAGPNVGR
jgi:hypothetical protein